MKKYLIFLLLSFVAVSCYEDYIFDYEYTGIYFPYQVDVRTFVVGEGMKIEVGAALGGVRDNDKDRVVNYTLDPTLINADILYRMQNLSSEYIRTATGTVGTLLQLPSNYYTISNSNEMVIKSGQHMGSVVIKPDSSTFLADPATIVGTYALPFRIQNAEADSVLKKRNYNVVAVKFENMLFGKYWHGGRTIRKDSVGSNVDTLNYYTQIPTIEAKIWTLTTIGPYKLVSNGFSNLVSTTNNQMTLDLSGGTVTISPAVGATYAITSDGASTYNQAKLLQNRKIFLNYHYTSVVNFKTRECYATDTLTFRNRIRDGINEWQDENPSHYTK